MADRKKLYYKPQRKKLKEQSAVRDGESNKFYYSFQIVDGLGEALLESQSLYNNEMKAREAFYNFKDEFIRTRNLVGVDIVAEQTELELKEILIENISNITLQIV